MESANLTVPEGPAEGMVFVGMADQEEQGEHKGEESDWPNDETQRWHHLHRRRVNSHAHPEHEVQRLAWDDWCTQFNLILYDHGMTDTDTELCSYMDKMLGFPRPS